MPGYVIHTVFAKLTCKKLDIKDKNRYFVGALLPDACTFDYDKKKEISHFTNRLYSILKNPDLDLFLEKYIDLFEDEVVLGIYSHLYLDKYFYNEFMYEIFEFNEETIINKKTGKKFKIFEEFFSRDGVYEEYTAMNKMFIKDYNIDMYSLDFNLKDFPAITEFNFSKLSSFRNKLVGFLEEEGRYTGEYVDYNKITCFLEKLAIRFVNHINQAKKC